VTLPARWTEALAAFNLDPPAPERRADCGACVMCAPDDPVAAQPELAYRPDVRCCSYTPGLWSFQVGGLLRDPAAVHPATRAALDARIDGPRSAPLGLLPREVDDNSYGDAIAEGRFGRDPALRCPHYVVDEGVCGVWDHRNATCATWFCRHDRGARGQQAWAALHHLLGLLEGWIAREAHAASGALGDGWAWAGEVDRRASYVAAAAFADRWDWEERLDQAPMAVIHAAASARLWRDRLYVPAPRLVRVGTWKVVAAEPDRAWVASDRVIDPVPVPATVALPADPLPWEHVVETLGEAAARALLDRDVLVPVDPADGRAAPIG
jgi:hypothetical protein